MTDHNENQGATVDRIIGRDTPTDDERETRRIAHLDARQAAYRKEREDWFVDHEAEPGIASNAFFRGWDAAVDGGFRRSEVPEPQGEPSDAQVEAALDAYMAHEGWETDEVGKAKMRGRMRAALRAAGEVRS